VYPPRARALTTDFPSDLAMQGSLKGCCGKSPSRRLASTKCILTIQSIVIDSMVGKEGGKAKPLKKAKKEGKELDETDLEFQKKKKEEAAALKALKEKAGAKGGFAKTKGSK